MGDGSCKTSYTTAVPKGGITGYKSVGQSTEPLKSAIMTGPVSVAIEADQMSFQMYSGGVLSSGCGTNLDHGVLAVGYDSNSFKLKNSWGTSWGNNGYIQISQSGNTCGIHSDASYPTINAGLMVSVDEEGECSKGLIDRIQVQHHQQLSEIQVQHHQQLSEQLHRNRLLEEEERNRLSEIQVQHHQQLSEHLHRNRLFEEATAGKAKLQRQSEEL